MLESPAIAPGFFALKGLWVVMLPAGRFSGARLLMNLRRFGGPFPCRVLRSTGQEPPPLAKDL